MRIGESLIIDNCHKTAKIQFRNNNDSIATTTQQQQQQQQTISITFSNSDMIIGEGLTRIVNDYININNFVKVKEGGEEGSVLVILPLLQFGETTTPQFTRYM